MTPTQQALSLVELAERCEKAAGPDREIDVLIHCATVVRLPTADAARLATNPFIDEVVMFYTASLDAAMTLIPEGFDWAVFRTNGGLTTHAWCGSREDVFGETPALALTAASLRAKASTLSTGDA